MFRSLDHPQGAKLFLAKVILKTFTNYFRCYTVHVVELLNYYTNYCTYI